MLKKIFAGLAIALVVILVFCWIYLPSFSRYHELKQEEQKLSKRIHEIDAQIKTLTDEKYLLQNDIAYLEKVIREELGFVKPGEIIYEMITKKTAAGPIVVTNAVNGSTDAGSSVSAMLPETKTSLAIADPTSSSRKVRAPSSKSTTTQKRPL